MKQNFSPEIWALIDLLAECAKEASVAHCSYIVGGGVRDFLLGEPVKDIDVVVEYQRGGKDASHLAHYVALRALRNFHETLPEKFREKYGDHEVSEDTLHHLAGECAKSVDQYGVVHIFFDTSCVHRGVELKGQKVEIVTARREKYDKTRRDSHKPASVEKGTLYEDVMRRDFTINTLCWRLSDWSAEEPGDQEVIDLTGRGLRDLRARVLNTPLDPLETFDEDPSRILRGIRFAAKYGFKIGETCELGMRLRVEELRRIPHELVDIQFVDKIMTLPKASRTTAVNTLFAFNVLPIVREVVPLTRLVKATRELDDVDLEIFMMDIGFQTPISKLPDACLGWLGRDRRFGGGADLPERERLAARALFLRPPVSATELMERTGISGPMVGRALRQAQEILADDPFMDPSELTEKVVKWIELTKE